MFISLTEMTAHSDPNSTVYIVTRVLRWCTFVLMILLPVETEKH